MGVCFLKIGVCFFWKSEFVFLKIGVRFSKIGVCFFVCDLQCDLLISGRRLSRPISVALSGYTVVTMLFNWKKVWHFSFKMALLLFLALNIVIGESVLPGYVPTLRVNGGLRSRILDENGQCQLFNLAHASHCLWQLYSQSLMFNLLSL